MDILVAFESTHAAMAAQKALKPLNCVILPTPREITASCGMSLKVKEHSNIEIEELLHAAAVQEALYVLYQIENRSTYRRLSS